MAFQRKKREAIGVNAPYLGFIDPALATSVEKVPSGARWIHEIKVQSKIVYALLSLSSRGWLRVVCRITIMF
jgi:hypothetical protein